MQSTNTLELWCWNKECLDYGRLKRKQRTRMMAEGLADHIWKLEELLMFRVPVQSLGDTTQKLYAVFQGIGECNIIC